VVNTLNLFRDGAVGFIDWLGAYGWLTTGPPYQKSPDARNSEIQQKNHKGIEPARRSAERVAIICHLAGDGIDDGKQRDRAPNKTTDEENQTGDTSNNLRGTHASNETEVSYRHWKRAGLEVKMF
jgi:hypothetical protein